tara:strand:+ start:738 stop:1139 length:402 start_codon:yes stop_codon:yes gene_type:complete
VNLRGSDLISPVMKAALAADLTALLGDAQVTPTTVVVSTTTGRAINDAAGTVTITSDDDTVSVLRCEVTLDEVQASAGGLQLGDIRYHIQATSLSSTPSLSSVVVDGSDRRRVVVVSTDPLGLLYTLTARRTP